MFKSVKRAIPAILSDIDGVVLRGGKTIGGSTNVMKSVLSNLEIGGH